MATKTDDQRNAEVRAEDEEALRAAAKKMVEAGLPCHLVAKKLGIRRARVAAWSEAYDWSFCDTPLSTNSTEKLLATLGKLTEADYDQQLRDLALSIPILVKRLPADDFVRQAEKVCKLIDMSQEILGKKASNKGRPMISVGILSAGRLPQRVELIDNQQVAPDSEE